MTAIVLSIYSLAKDAWNLIESRLTPKNSMDVLGPSFFLGKENSELRKNTLNCYEVRGWDGVGGEMIRKSSNRWMRCGIA